MEEMEMPSSVRRAVRGVVLAFIDVDVRKITQALLDPQVVDNHGTFFRYPVVVCAK